MNKGNYPRIVAKYAKIDVEEILERRSAAKEKRQIAMYMRAICSNSCMILTKMGGDHEICTKIEYGQKSIAEV